MLDLVARILPVASAIAVAALTIFNIGYSWRIGLHFLGIIDINNVVYSFGLAFGLLIVLFLFVQWVISLSGPVSETFKQRTMCTTAIFISIGMGAVLLGPLIVDYYGWNRSKHEWESWHEALWSGVVLASNIWLGVNWSVQSFLRYKTSGIVNTTDLLVLSIAAVLIFFLAGRFAAEWQMISDATYTIAAKGISEKGETIQNARLLRTSSAGVILLADQRILFIPHSKIVQIKRTCDLDKPWC